MKYARLGNTGLTVSRLCLGCGSYGSKKFQDWIVEENEALPIIKRAYDLGINFFDTANSYSWGESERILGKAIKKYNLPREKLVIATKTYIVDEGHDINNQHLGKTNWDDLGYANMWGLSRKNIFRSVDKSLERLGLDYIDLFQIHRWDHNTPIEETMRALHDVVQSGKVRYIGAISIYAWQFAKANHIAEKNGWTPFISMQNLYNLMYREEEREMNPYCLDAGVGLIPWSPLQGGKLTAKNRQTLRATKGFDASDLSDVDNKVLDRVIEVATTRGGTVTAAQVSIAWLWTKPVVISPIVGATRVEYLEDVVRALDVTLTEEEIKALEEPYQPRAIVGHV